MIEVVLNNTYHGIDFSNVNIQNNIICTESGYILIMINKKYVWAHLKNKIIQYSNDNFRDDITGFDNYKAAIEFMQNMCNEAVFVLDNFKELHDFLGDNND